MSQFGTRIEKDRATGHWLVVVHTRLGWSVRYRGFDIAAAQDVARALADARRDLDREAV